MATKISGTFTGTGISESQYLSDANYKADPGFMALSISGTFVGTVVLERAVNSSADYKPVESYTTLIETNVQTADASVKFRLNYTHTSGSVVYYLGRG
jgi:hypothetical protein